LTVAGAALGASIARDRANRRAPPPNPVYATPRRCTAGFRTRTVPAIEGYDVTYRYRGQNFSKWVAEHPGRTVPVRITVAPVERFSKVRSGRVQARVKTMV